MINLRFLLLSLHTVTAIVQVTETIVKRSCCVITMFKKQSHNQMKHFWKANVSLLY